MERRRLGEKREKKLILLIVERKVLLSTMQQQWDGWRLESVITHGWKMKMRRYIKEMMEKYKKNTSWFKGMMMEAAAVASTAVQIKSSNLCK